MDNVMTFGDILEVADRLSVDDQESLSDILRRRVIERRREGIARDIEEAHEALKAGKCRPAAPDEIFDETADPQLCQARLGRAGLRGREAAVVLEVGDFLGIVR